MEVEPVVAIVVVVMVTVGQQGVSGVWWSIGREGGDTCCSTTKEGYVCCGPSDGGTECTHNLHGDGECV